jgi:CheY-like chemotaxis protein
MENTSSSQKCILIVEDEADTAEMFAEMMRVSGYRVIKAYGGTSAIKLLTTESPDVLLVDVMMPDISGLEVLRFLKREPRLANIPVIVVSARAMPSDIRDGLEAGAAYYLTKPVAYDDLISTVERAIDQASQHLTDLEAG